MMLTMNNFGYVCKNIQILKGFYTVYFVKYICLKLVLALLAKKPLFSCEIPFCKSCINVIVFNTITTGCYI